MSRFANLADKQKDRSSGSRNERSAAVRQPIPLTTEITTPLSRIGRKAISAYFSPEMSLAMHVCARKHGLSLQALMGEAFDDVLRKYGESPIGE